jgi:putative transposase
MSQYKRNYKSGGTYFFTVVAYKRQKIFVASALDVLRTCFKETITETPFAIDAIVVLPEHLHCIWRLPDGDTDFSTRWKKIKAGFSKEYRHMVDSSVLKISESMQHKGESGIWQRRFWEHTIRDEKDFRIHCDYIHYNPVKHGYVQAPNEWPNSSYHRFVKAGLYDNAWGSTQCPQFPDNIGGE